MRLFGLLGRSITTIALVLVGCSDAPIDEYNGPPLFEVNLDESNNRLKVSVYPALKSGQTLHARIRNGSSGRLECGQMLPEIPRIDEQPIASESGDTFLGPMARADMFLDQYNTAFVEALEPTQDMINIALAGTFTIDLCLMNGDQVVRKAELDIRRALDKKGSGKFDGYGDANEEIRSTVAYGEACVNNLGEIPFFEKIADNDYATYNCLDSVPIPMTVTLEDGTKTFPETTQSKCDDPQFIYNSCEPNAVNGRTNGPRVARRVNDQGTYWVLLCRKALTEEGQYNDVAMIGHNPYTGKTCYFQNALYSKTDGVHIPHPADDLESTASPQTSNSLWNGIHGGLGSGIQCAECHSTDPFIHTPWIDGAKDENGDTVIPMMGVHDGYTLGFNEAPYSIVDTEGQGWTMPKNLVNAETAACTKCHRVSNGRWAKSWLRRLEGTDTFWNDLLTDEGMKFEKRFWMPPEMHHLDESTWADSEYGKALDFIQACARPSNPTGDSGPIYDCKFEDLPTEQVIDVGELPEVELEGSDLALEALKILGANVSDLTDERCDGDNGDCATRRCAECHSVSKGGLRHWLDLTQNALNRCNLKLDPEVMSQQQALESVHCMRARSTDPTSVFAADKIGILTTGARYGYFRQLFQKAYGETEWLRQFVSFKGRVGMPKGTYSALNEREYAVILKWFEQKLPDLDAVIQDPPAPTSCEPFIDAAAIEAHVSEMAFEGWGAVNQENGIRMFGCEGGSARNCFQTGYVDRSSDWGGAKGQLREVLKLQFKTSFWTRSSADGRFVANGGGVQGGATVTDLLRNRDIKVKASYDPSFFPDNSGFIFQGGGTGICPQSILETAEEITFEEEGCIRGTNINLYQHVARGSNGGDYFVINSQFTSDSGRNRTTSNPVAHFGGNATMKFSPMIFNGSQYEQLRSVIVDSPFEGDSVLSPSGKLVVSRLAGGADGDSLGYVIRKVVTTRTADSYDIDIGQVVARLCIPGAKANISFDERFVATHQYTGDRSVIILVDLKTGEQHLVADVPEGTKALFPHFRSDNWLYFLMRDGQDEYVVASDLAIQLAEVGGQAE
ncbi:MAG: hypothetical protein CMH52_13775 [Myxococcales bacterium]|nr:hypothetical protein [Myxococcales bacterium]